MVAALTTLPVIGVPVPLKYLDGMDSLLSIVQMPAGVPVATVSIAGARNAGLLAVRILAASDPALAQRMAAFQEQLADSARPKDAALQARLDALTDPHRQRPVRSVKCHSRRCVSAWAPAASWRCSSSWSSSSPVR